VKSSTRLGRHRSKVERWLAWLVGHRRLQVLYERSSERLYTLVVLACSIICIKPLQQSPW
jgi:hypothetical protein